ncbi:MAG: phosphodiester glycosidase family protein [Myxococcales bacterium]|nr:phosphodiester glycosidase family protein [Myxococcales bacterium]
MMRALALLALTTLPGPLAPTHAVAADEWTNVSAGVRLLRRTTGQPWRIFALTADLCTPGLRLQATSEADHWRTVPSYGQRVGAIAAVNADFFSYDTQRPTGLAMSGGTTWNPDMAGSGDLLFGDDRALLVPPGRVADPPFWAREAVGGRPLLVDQGVVPADFNRADCSVRHPRTAVGLSADRRQLILAVVDGRTAQSVGMTCAELGRLMRDLGADTAMNLDGGGSSTLWTSRDGVVNRPSDGSPRTVANHLALIAGDGPARACDFTFAEGFEQAAVLDTGHTDVNGDGLADVCGRDADGFVCHPATGAGFGDPWRIPGTADANGWADVANYSTLRMADIDGDGRADLCARANAGIRCWRSNGAGFDAALAGPALSDADGWDDRKYGTTLRFADVNGDGRDDLCARAAAGIRCYPSTGDGFGPAFEGPALSDESGWGAPEHYGTLRFGDVDGDGRADLCARGGAGMRCWPSRGDGFAAAIDGPRWSDAAGFDDVSKWSTIRLIDLDGDGRAELCARTAAGLECARYAEGAFAAPFAGPALSDGSGWADHDNYGTLRFGDVDGDGDQDLCARANRGVLCWPYTGDGFGASFDGPAWSDDEGWNDRRYNTTLALADVDGDGRADLCGRAARGVLCAPSQGAGFGAPLPAVPFGNEQGFAALEYRSTIRVASPRVRPEVPVEPGVDAGVPDVGVSRDAGAGDAGVGDVGVVDARVDPADVGRPEVADARPADPDGAVLTPEAGVGTDATAADDDPDRGIRTGCTATVGAEKAPAWLLALVIGAVVARRRRPVVGGGGVG